MNHYDELVAGKSLDNLLREAKQLDLKEELLSEAKQQDLKEETALAKIEKKERAGNYNNELAIILGEDLATQNYGAFFKAMQKISDISDLFHAKGDISLVLKNFAELHRFLDDIEIPKKLNCLLSNTRSIFCEGGGDYIKTLKNPTANNLKIGSKVKTIFTLFSETKLSTSDKKYKYERSDGGYNDSTGDKDIYFNMRNRNFPLGSIGKVIGHDTDSLVIQFDKEGKWDTLWLPDCNYWGEKKNAALYELKELEILPHSALEISALETLLTNFSDKLYHL